MPLNLCNICSKLGSKETDHLSRNNGRCITTWIHSIVTDGNVHHIPQYSIVPFSPISISFIPIYYFKMYLYTYFLHTLYSIECNEYTKIRGQPYFPDVQPIIDDHFSISSSKRGECSISIWYRNHIHKPISYVIHTIFFIRHCLQ